MEALQSGRSPVKNNAGKVNACLVETPEQLVAFGHHGLRSSLGQNALGPPLIGLTHAVDVRSAMRGFELMLGEQFSSMSKRQHWLCTRRVSATQNRPPLILWIQTQRNRLGMLQKSWISNKLDCF